MDGSGDEKSKGNNSYWDWILFWLALCTLGQRFSTLAILRGLDFSSLVEVGTDLKVAKIEKR